MEQRDMKVGVDPLCNRPIYRSMLERDIALLEQMLRRLDERYASHAAGIKVRIAELQRVKQGADRRMKT